jgi:glc operon protein GlcG
MLLHTIWEVQVNRGGGGHLLALGRMSGAAPLSARIAETKAASVALFRRDGAALRQLQEANPGFFAQLDRAVRVPILAGAGAALIQRGTPSWVQCR